MCDQQSLRSACAYAQSDQSLCFSLEYSMSFQLLTEHHLEFLSLKGSCTGWSESTLVKMPHCWKSHVTAHLFSAGQLADKDEEKDSFNTRMTLSSISSSIPESDKKKQINCMYWVMWRFVIC